MQSDIFNPGNRALNRWHHCVVSFLALPGEACFEALEVAGFFNGVDTFCGEAKQVMPVAKVNDASMRNDIVKRDARNPTECIIVKRLPKWRLPYQSAPT